MDPRDEEVKGERARDADLRNEADPRDEEVKGERARDVEPRMRRREEGRLWMTGEVIPLARRFD